MMDERTIAAAEAETERQRQRALENRKQLKSYTIVVIGRFESVPLQIQALNSQDRVDQMLAEGVDVNRDRWAAAHHDGRSYQTCGNDAEARQILEKHLSKKR